MTELKDLRTNPPVYELEFMKMAAVAGEFNMKIGQLYELLTKEKIIHKNGMPSDDMIKNGYMVYYTNTTKKRTYYTPILTSKGYFILRDIILNQ